MNIRIALALLLAVVPLLPLSVPAALVNVALDAPVHASGALFGGDDPARLTDGLRDRQIHADAAPPDGFAYWIDLGAARALSQIRIWPRQDGCCGERFSNVRVSVHDDDGQGNIGPETWHGDLFTNGTNPGATNGAVVVVTAAMGSGNFAGRWVRLTALSTPVPSYALQVTELEVFADGLPNIALGAAVTASAPLYQGRSPARLVNGVRAGAPEEVLHGDSSFAPYDPTDTVFRYEINLGAPATLDRIKIVARQDGCCGERLSNYRVSIHDDDAGRIGQEVWAATLHGDFSNPGSGPGAKDVIPADLDPFDAFAGQWIRIASLESPVSAFALQMQEVEVYGTLTGPVLLRAVNQPQDAHSALGRTVTFRFEVVAAGGDSALLTYQWQKNGVPIPGAVAASYVTPALVTADETNLFRCVARYPGSGSVTSAVAGIDLNYALGAAAFANGPLWGPGGWDIRLIVDGNHDANGGFGGVHGAENPPPGFAYWFDMHTPVLLRNVVVWARQDGCCGGRLTNYRLSVHDDANGAIGPEVWGATLHADGSNAGSGAGARDVISADLDPAGTFAGRWVKITSLESPVQNYALQVTEIEAFGSVPPDTKVVILQQPVNAGSAPFRTATFRAAATVLNGDPATLTYQWQQNGAPIPGATSPAYTTPPLCADDAGAHYRCLLSYPGLSPVPTDEVTLNFDYNYARGSQAYTSQPLWLPGAWNISKLVDGDRLSAFHGDENIQPGFAYTVNLGFPVEIERMNLYPRQDGCCGERFTNLRVSVHRDNGSGAIGDEVWGTSLFTDHTNPGSGGGVVVSVTSDLDPAGIFSGQWIKVESLENPVQNYALQMTELEVIGKARALCFKRTAAGRVILSWDHGTLLSAPSLAGPWGEVNGAVSPLTLSNPGPDRFYRLLIR